MHNIPITELCPEELDKVINIPLTQAVEKELKVLLNRDLGSAILKWSNTASEELEALGWNMLMYDCRPTRLGYTAAIEHFESLINGNYTGTTKEDISEWWNIIKQLSNSALKGQQ